MDGFLCYAGLHAPSDDLLGKDCGCCVLFSCCSCTIIMSHMHAGS